MWENSGRRARRWHRRHRQEGAWGLPGTHLQERRGADVEAPRWQKTPVLVTKRKCEGSSLCALRREKTQESRC